jgi:hypothetical protein
MDDLRFAYWVLIYKIASIQKVSSLNALPSHYVLNNVTDTVYNMHAFLTLTRLPRTVLSAFNLQDFVDLFSNSQHHESALFYMWNKPWINFSSSRNHLVQSYWIKPLLLNAKIRAFSQHAFSLCLHKD